MIWPNPADSEIHVLLPSFNYERIEVIDISGRVIRSFPFAENGRITVATGGWSAGVYFLRITGSEGTIIEKIIKQGQ